MSFAGRTLGRWTSTTTRWGTATLPRSRAAWTCAECHGQAAGRATKTDKIGTLSTLARGFSSTTRRQDDKTEERLRRIQEENAARVRKEEEEAQLRAEQEAQRLRDEEAEAERRAVEAQQRLQEQDEPKSQPSLSSQPQSATATATSTAPATAAESSTALPSHAESRRSDLQKRLTQFLDDLLLHASRIGQQVNQYTGTDYSGIENLRKEISSQEQKVRQLRRSVDEARNVHHDAYAQQTSSQREIVALLERKSSWSPTDLERYMSLVRSEHLNEQSVSSAKSNLDVAENSLEEARSLLERLERKQYHEEQIWSDTIRRNSTWVTFGLMGFNIILLLANIVIFEPYRRKKIAKDVKGLLDEKAAIDEKGTLRRTAVEVSEKGVQVDEAELRSLEEFEKLKRAEEERPFDVAPPAEVQESASTLTSGEMLPLEASEVVGAVLNVSDDIAKSKATTKEQPQPVRSTWDSYQDALGDLFSERVVQMRKVDVTNIALQGAASGFAIMGLLFILLRPK
ncbi:hypothetical protein CBER1_08690 [Cercospora berteroae]|uniref:Sensitive to high expression protein 9, mitochondrial n=1 Tax=Cercospora berteroae TaxID=357750 RepID=A0A2S6C6K8_9PEZI|nr:hypothetical protein CBER1_08690 [Cercospora berteroae]